MEYHYPAVKVCEAIFGELPAPVSQGGFAVQIAETSGSYAVPAGYTTITAWSHSAGATPGPLTFKVYRPTGAPREFITFYRDSRIVLGRNELAKVTTK